MSITTEEFITDNPQTFAAQLDKFASETQELVEGTVIKGVVVSIDKECIGIDIGSKSFGYIAITEFGEEEIKIGDIYELLLERIENRRGSLVLSREKALRSKSWSNLKVALADGAIVTGKIFGKVKGGFAVNIDNVIAFLPRSQVDTSLVQDIDYLMNQDEKFIVLKIDDMRGNVVVSRRAVLEIERKGEKDEVLSKIKVGDVLEGIVKNIMDYGAFIDLGSFDGLLHLTDISWSRTRHPSEALTIGQKLDVKVIKFDSETKRVSLGIKQLKDNPWESLAMRYPVNTVLKGKITNLTDYGAFVEIEDGIEGLVHVSEMSWAKNNAHPSKLAIVGQEVDVAILAIDIANHRISLGMKQCSNNPWENFAAEHEVGSEIEGEIRNVAEFGLFIALSGGIDGLIHASDLSWDGEPEEAIKKYTKGDIIKAIILAIDPKKERISLGIKQLVANPSDELLNEYKKGDIITCVITHIEAEMITVALNESLTSVIKRTDLSKDRSEQRTERFAIGNKIDAKVVSVDRASGKISLSVKELEIDEQKRMIKEYGSSDSGATLGDILGAVFEGNNDKKVN